MKSAGFFVGALLIGAFYELYLDILLTKYYLQALHTHKTFYICALEEPCSHLMVFGGDFEPIQPIFIPPFYEVQTKSLSRKSSCFLLSPHEEGFLPGSIRLKGPLHRSRWTLSYAGRLKYQPEAGLYLSSQWFQSIEREQSPTESAH